MPDSPSKMLVAKHQTPPEEQNFNKKTINPKNISKHTLVLSNSLHISIESLIKKNVQLQANVDNVDNEQTFLKQNMYNIIKHKKPQKPNDCGVYFLKNGAMKPIPSPNVRSGIFRSNDSLPAVVEEKTPTKNNVAFLNCQSGGIILMDQFRQHKSEYEAINDETSSNNYSAIFGNKILQPIETDRSHFIVKE